MSGTKQLSEVQLVGYNGSMPVLHEQFGTSLLSVSTVTEINAGTYRDVTTVTIKTPWKLRPSARAKKKWWQR